jgi:hypothetical protein
MPSHVISQTPTGNPTTNFSITMSASIRDLDIVIVTATHKGTGTPTIGDSTPSGMAWNVIAHIDDGTGSFTAWWAYATIETPGASVSVSGATNCVAGGLSVYRGAAGEEVASPIVNISAESNASANETHAGFTPQGENSTIVLCNGNRTNDIAVDTQACTDPGTLTERHEKLSTGGTD